MQKFNINDYGNPLDVIPGGKPFVPGPSCFKLPKSKKPNEVKYVSLDPRCFRMPPFWDVQEVSLVDQYDNDNNKTGVQNYRAVLINGVIAKSMLDEGQDPTLFGLPSVVADCKSGVDLSKFKRGDLVKLVAPLILLQYSSAGNFGSYRGVKFAIKNLVPYKKDGKQNG